MRSAINPLSGTIRDAQMAERRIRCLWHALEIYSVGFFDFFFPSRIPKPIKNYFLSKTWKWQCFLSVKYMLVSLYIWELKYQICNTVLGQKITARISSILFCEGYGKNCLGTLWMVHPWQCSRPGRMEFWIIWSRGRHPCPFHERWNHIPSSPSHSMIPWSYAKLTHNNFNI